MGIAPDHRAIIGLLNIGNSHAVVSEVTSSFALGYQKPSDRLHPFVAKWD